MNDAGRVMILPKGKYSATVQYDKLDSVTYNGSAWVATQSTIGNEPADDSDYWILFVKGGGVTADGTSLEMDADGVLGIKDGVIPDVDGSTIVKDDNNIIRIADALKKLIDGAVQEVAGKGLSTNDFTDTLLQKLNGIAEGANNYSLPDATSSIKGGVILSNSEAVTDSTGMALPATEKNASLEGTLANKISELNSNIPKLHGGSTPYTTFKIYHTRVQLSYVYADALRYHADLPITFSSSNTTCYVSKKWNNIQKYASATLSIDMSSNGKTIEVIAYNAGAFSQEDTMTVDIMVIGPIL